MLRQVLQYLRARYNQLGSGRFISTDPFTGTTDLPMSRHRYSYSYGNPLSYLDPSGQITMADISASFSLSSILESLTLVGLAFAPAQFLGSQFAGIEGDSIPWKGVKGSVSGFGDTRLLLSQGLGGDIYGTSSESVFEGRPSNLYGAILAIHANYGISTPPLIPGVRQTTPLASAGTFDVKTPLAFGRSIFSLGGGYISVGFSGAFGFGFGLGLWSG